MGIDRIIQSEICVIGGGPAGSTIARRLALLGHDVCLIERDPFPRPHVGESLPPSILPILGSLGVSDRIERASFLRPERSIVRWSSSRDMLKSTGDVPAFQVDRGQFDQLLLQAADEAGVTILQPVRALRPRREGFQRWQVVVDGGGRECRVSSRFLVDASGKGAMLPSRRRRCSVPTVALYAYWRDANLAGPETRVEAGADAWYWGAPLPDGTVNATVFVDARRLSAVGRDGRGRLYRSLLVQSTLLRDCLGGTMIGTPRVCDASSYADESPIDQCSIKVGEASSAIDPLSSQGVQAAMLSALQGSIAVHTILTAPENTPAAIQFYSERQAERVARHQKWAAGYYAAQQLFPFNEFWNRRAEFGRTADLAEKPVRVVARLTEDCPIRLSDEVRLADLPVIRGNLVEAAKSLTHPSLDRPVAFLNEIPVAPLLANLQFGQTAGDLLRMWSGVVPAGLGREILGWMWSRGLMVSARCESEAAGSTAGGSTAGASNGSSDPWFLVE